MILCADIIVPMNGPPIQNGAVAVTGNRIDYVGPLSGCPPFPDKPIKILPETVLLPGLVNAHGHLEEGFARAVLPEKEDKPMWEARLAKLTTAQSVQAFRDAVQLGMLECIRTGTTSIMDTGDYTHSFDIIAQSDMRVFACKTLVGADGADIKKVISDVGKFLELSTPSASLVRRSLSIKSPFLFPSEFRNYLEKRNRPSSLPLPVHFFESEHDHQFAQGTTSRLFEYYRRAFGGTPLFAGRPPHACLSDSGILDMNPLFIHCNNLDDNTISLIQNCGASVVHCPRSHAFFQYPDFQFEKFFNSGINVCLGTESLASSDNYNLFDEMLSFRSRFPHVDCEELLKMVTIKAAKAIGQQSHLGCIKEGFLADVIGINIKHQPACNIFDELVCEVHDVNFVMINGQEVMS